MQPLRIRTFSLTALVLLGAPLAAQGADLSLQLHNWANVAALESPYDPDDPLAQILAMDEVDVWERIRKGFGIPDLENPLVSNHTQWYSSRPDYIQRTTTRASRYLFHVVQELEKRNMPTELALLPFIESAFNPQAYSSAKAAGMWQFIPSTGRDYNLTQSMFMDDRRNVLASTDAALTYLQRLYGMFGDWQLALAAYNWGEGSVQRAINKARAAGVTTDFNGLSQFMPAETRNYVPKLQAVKNIIATPSDYGITLPKVDNQPYFVTIGKTRDIDVKVAAQLAELSIDEFKALNPQFNKPVIPGGAGTQLLLPQGNAEKFKTNLAKWGRSLSSWTAHKVTTARERIENIAKKFDTTPEVIREVNNIPPKMLLKQGSTILVPKVESGSHKDIAPELIETAAIVTVPDTPETRRIYVKVGKRDTLTSIARRHKVSTEQIKSWNDLKQDKVRAGQKLELNVPNKPASKRSRTRQVARKANAPSRKAAPAPARRTKAAASSASKTSKRKPG
ncbi:MAG TPA: transglycosylase SLT domain-containing protein [Noviherbaspirillum sp.]|nr:transglycosylase SLT domain-containing protein [Noviherbaspirillum sp.]